MTDLQDDYDDDFYEDDFTDDDEDGRGSSKLLETSKSIVVSKPPPKRTKAFTNQTSVNTHRSDKRMPRRAEGRVQSSKRRQHMSLRNQYSELSINYDEILKENKLLKQIQKRQERELDKYNNPDEDLPRLLDANNYEIAGLKAKKQTVAIRKAGTGRQTETATSGNHIAKRTEQENDDFSKQQEAWRARKT